MPRPYARGRTNGPAYGGPVRPLTAAAAVDVLAVVAFATAGRRNHAEGLDVAGVLGTAGPFLVAGAAGWAVTRAWRRPAAVVPTGLVVWGVTLVGGMLLRRLVGEGTAPAFVVVATLVLGGLLLGWRVLAQAVSAASRRSRSRTSQA